MERANLLRPDMVRDVVDGFLDAGARVLVTNTAAANSPAMAQTAEGGEVCPEDLEKMNRLGAAICRSAVSEHSATDALVFGAIGPTDRLLGLGEIDAATLSAAYHAQATALAAGGADAIVCRAFTDIAALTLAVRAVTEATGLAAIGSLVFDSGPERTETSLGVTVPQACAELAEAGAAVIGCECGECPDGGPAVVTLMRQSSDLPIWVKVDAGEPQLVDGRVVYPESPEAFALRLAPLAEAGGNFIGGCCGATAEHIAALAASLAKREREA